MIRVNHLRGGETEEWVDGYENDADGESMDGTSPLEEMIRGDKEGWSNISFPEGREWTIVGLMNQGEVGMANLETSQKSVIPGGKIYIRIGYKGRGEGVGGERVGIA